MITSYNIQKKSQSEMYRKAWRFISSFNDNAFFLVEISHLSRDLFVT